MKPSFLFGMFAFALFIHLGCQAPSSATTDEPESAVQEPPPPAPAAWYGDGFDFPVGPPDASGYYDANPFQTNGHLGSDWNGRGGGNSDLGDPVYAMAVGEVLEAYDAGPGWGLVIRMLHPAKDSQAFPVEAIYAHLDTMLVQSGDTIARGQQIGTIGNANGAYWAHLHFEIRRTLGMPLGGGYSADTSGFLDPTPFIEASRPD
ncbi:MAG: M23 family metallopeptidase [Bacteroidota bacterium]